MTGTRSRWLSAGPVVLLTLVGVAAAVRLWALDDRNIWVDEAASWRTASRPVPELLASAAEDIHPPLYYLALKAWTTVAGDTPSGLRGLAVVFGMLAVALAARLAADRLDRPAFLATVGWIAVAPSLVFYSQEARMYAPATAMVLGASLAYRRWVESGFERSGMLAAFAAATIAGLYLHYFTALVLVPLWLHFTFVAGRAGPAPTIAARRGAWRQWLLAHTAILLCYVPWLPIAVGQILEGQSWRQPVAIGEIPVYAARLGIELLAGYQVDWNPARTSAFVVVALVTVAGWIVLVGTQFSSRRAEWDLWLVLIVLLPAGVALAALPVTGDMRLSRYLAFLTPLVVLGAARGLSMLTARRAVAASLVVVAATASLPALGHQSRFTSHDVDVRPVVRAIERAAAAGARHELGRELIVTEPGFIDLCLRYYWRDRNLHFIRITADDHRGTVLQRAAQHGPFWYVAARGAVTVDPRSTPEGLRLEEVALDPPRPERVRLFRVTGAPALGRQ